MSISASRGKKPAPAPAEPYVSLTTAAEYFSLSERTLRRYISTGKIPGKRLGSTIRVRISEIEEAMIAVGSAAR